MAKLLLIGSSIMEQWHRPELLAPGWQVVNRAIGGTTTVYWMEHLATVLTEEQPTAVLTYVGSNDLAQGATTEAIQNGVRRCRDILQQASSDVPFGYLSIIKAPQRLGRFHEIAAANAAVRSVLLSGDLWLDTDPVFLKDGAPVARYYIEDGLHLNADAYHDLAAMVSPELSAWLAAIPCRQD